MFDARVKEDQILFCLNVIQGYIIMKCDVERTALSRGYSNGVSEWRTGGGGRRSIYDVAPVTL
jgi:hypothetical protein